MRLPNLLAASIVCAVSGSCGGSPRVSNASLQECHKSLAAVARSPMGRSDSIAFAGAFLRLAGAFVARSMADAFSGAFGIGDENSVSVVRPPSDSALFSMALCDALNGLTAKQITAGVDSLGTRLALAYGRRQDSVYVEALQQAKVAAAAIRDSLAAFRVVSSRLIQRTGYFNLEAVIALIVENRTRHSISRAYFRGRAISDGRQVPWLDETFNYDIPGGLEPGESASWRLSPNAFSGRWGTVRVPPDARFLVDVVKLDGPDKLPLWGGATFTRADQHLLDSLRARIRQATKAAAGD